MRLQAIKLSGFKSFVDPTTVRFPSNLCAVVGPNGCGKSNIIDAVRWVMGESSAKNLRGESMADVIFNGSTSRKPIGQASIELRFDNTEGKLTGEYASYSEISIQRKVTRDGQSIYYLNGQKCRRKDITDIFLGTGLGPRSYSIIEQGMISQLVEAKPDELRVYIEEAAGISKYKERRRETERRISHTKENLDRLSDIREELDRQLHHLQRQARAAERYKKLKKEERYLEAQLQGLRWSSINAEAGKQEDNIRKLEIELEARIAEHRSIDTEIEKHRDQQVELSEKSNEVQKRYYDLGTEIARIEESAQHQQERNRQWKIDLEGVMNDWKSVETDMAADREKVAELSESIKTTGPQVDVAQEKETVSGRLLLSAEEQMQQWQLKWDEFNHHAAEPRQQAEVEQSRIRHLEESIQRLDERLVNLQKENQALNNVSFGEEIAPLESLQLEKQAEIDVSQEKISKLVNAIEQQRVLNQDCSRDLDQTRSELQRSNGRFASLEALQQAALGQQDHAGVEWLERHNLSGLKRLAEELRVQDGWEQAVETVLGKHLQAVCVEGIDAVSTLLGDFAKGSLGFLEMSGEPGPQTVPATENSLASATLLASCIETEWDLAPLLNGIYIAEDLPSAMQMRHSLAVDQSIITRDGLWIGRNWLRVHKEDDAEAGVIRRQQELQDLSAGIGRLESKVDQVSSQLDAGTAQLQAHEKERDEVQLTLSRQQTGLHELKAELSALRVQLEKSNSDLQRTENEIEESRVQLETDRQSLSVARSSLEEALDLMEQNEIQRERFLAEREDNQKILEETRQRARDDKDSAHLLALEKQSINNQLHSTQQAMERLTGQLATLEQRKVDLQESIEQSKAPLESLKTELAAQLQKRLIVEQELTSVRQSVESVEHSLRELEAKRSNTEEQTEQVRSGLSQVKMEWQALDVRRTSLREQLEKESFNLEEIISELPEDATETSWEAELTRMSSRIQRLGAINLAAIEEYEVQSERKQYLDAQNEDLESALSILQNAIRKIDKETRTRFKETFDHVNGKLQLLFPKLFGGGHAYLEMTGDDLLDTGVGFMARPPGKRNASIHLLSGGEKALTAIALVFSIFSLNPAPFCMLDEVDAPLDDANVQRYSDLVEEMSRTVQFIYITHNKISMEMAHQLMGVTMHEAGVSRLVTVDVDEAVALAAV
jgi:chromosome segregation protein